jgi:hypothetical protein
VPLLSGPSVEVPPAVASPSGGLTGEETKDILAALRGGGGKAGDGPARQMMALTSLAQRFADEADKVPHEKPIVRDGLPDDLLSALTQYEGEVAKHREEYKALSEASGKEWQACAAQAVAAVAARDTTKLGAAHEKARETAGKMSQFLVRPNLPQRLRDDIAKLRERWDGLERLLGQLYRSAKDVPGLLGPLDKLAGQMGDKGPGQRAADNLLRGWLTREVVGDGKVSLWRGTRGEEWVDNTYFLASQVKWVDSKEEEHPIDDLFRFVSGGDMEKVAKRFVAPGRLKGDYLDIKWLKPTPQGRAAREYNARMNKAWGTWGRAHLQRLGELVPDVRAHFPDDAAKLARLKELTEAGKLSNLFPN